MCYLDMFMANSLFTDNIFLKYNPQTTFIAGSIMTDISDYYFILFFENSLKTMDASKIVKRNNFSECSVDNFKHALFTKTGIT